MERTVQNFLKIAENVDTVPMLLALRRNPQLWGQNPERQYAPGTPHAGMTDIWLRYNDRRPFDAGERPFSEINDPHESVWYPASDFLPQARPIVFGLMARVEGERLGGILITKLPPGGKIAPHTDGGWHAGNYDKYYVALQNEPGSEFYWGEAGEGGTIRAKTGDVYWFRNDIIHGVRNDSADDRIAMIVCIQGGKPWQA